MAKDGLSAWAQTASSSSGSGQCASPPTTPFTMQLPIMPQKQPIAVTSLAGPAPTIQPNTNINPATGLAFEGRTRAHQAPALGFPFPPPVIHQVSQQAGQANMSNQLPLQTIWGFDGISPGPTYVERYGSPVLVRNFNNLPSSNGGFGNPSVSTHLHNGHTPSESDGFPCDFFARGQYYDQYYPNVLAGFNSDHKPAKGQSILTAGDINESLSTLWYHDHRVPSPDLPDLRHPDAVRRPVLRPGHGVAGLRPLQSRRHPRRQVPGERRDPAGAACPPAPLSPAVAEQRPVALLSDLHHGSEQSERQQPVLADLERRQPAAHARPSSGRADGSGRARRCHHRLLAVRGQDHLPREPAAASQRPRPHGPGSRRGPGQSAAADRRRSCRGGGPERGPRHGTPVLRPAEHERSAPGDAQFCV